MEQPFWTIYLQKKMSENFDLVNNLNKHGISIYLFGSALSIKEPNDLDIMMIYDAEVTDIHSVLKIKNELKDYLKEKTPLPIDLLLLSDNEDLEIDFIRKEQAAILTYLKDRIINNITQ